MVAARRWLLLRRAGCERAARSGTQRHAAARGTRPAASNGGTQGRRSGPEQAHPKKLGLAPVNARAPPVQQPLVRRCSKTRTRAASSVSTTGSAAASAAASASTPSSAVDETRSNSLVHLLLHAATDAAAEGGSFCRSRAVRSSAASVVSSDGSRSAIRSMQRAPHVQALNASRGHPCLRHSGSVTCGGKKRPSISSSCSRLRSASDMLRASASRCSAERTADGSAPAGVTLPSSSRSAARTAAFSCSEAASHAYSAPSTSTRPSGKVYDASAIAPAQPIRATTLAGKVSPRRRQLVSEALRSTRSRRPTLKRPSSDAARSPWRREGARARRTRSVAPRRPVAR